MKLYSSPSDQVASLTIMIMMLLEMEFRCGLAIIQMEEKIVCPLGYTFYEGGNFCLSKINAFYASFSKHYDFCKKNTAKYTYFGGLITLTSWKSFLEYKRVTMPRTCNTVWMGATDHQEEGIFKWVSNGQRINYAMQGRSLPWVRGHPNDPNTTTSNQDCLIMYSFHYLLSDFACNDRRHCGICSIYEANMCKINNGGCQHLCVVTGPHNRTCACRPGFRHVGMFFCEDIDECLTLSNGNCQHICNNFHGGRECFCHEGYEQASETVCVAKDSCQIKNGGCMHVCKTENNGKGHGKCECLSGYELWNSTLCKKITTKNLGAAIFIMAACSVSLSIIAPSALMMYYVSSINYKEREEEEEERKANITTITHQSTVKGEEEIKEDEGDEEDDDTGSTII